MNKLSRRALARYAADQLLSGSQPVSLGRELAASLVESGRAAEVEFLLSDIAWELEARQELVIGRVSSHTALSKSLEAALRSQLKALTKASEVLLQTSVDQSLLGGLKIETASWVWDLSVARELKRLREVF